MGLPVEMCRLVSQQLLGVLPNVNGLPGPVYPCWHAVAHRLQI